MSHAMMLQDYTTITAPSGATIIQNEAAWLDVSGYQDLCVYFDMPQINATATGSYLYVQTSPTKDAAFFDAFASGSAPGSIAAFQLNAAVGVQGLKISRWATEAVQPLAKYLRWKLVFSTTGAPFTMTFRLWLTLNQAGY